MSGEMAHRVEPIDIDCINSDFDDKENTFNPNNALPCTEKGYEELDVSELNMKLRYSITPTASPMSKSFTNCIDNSSFDSEDAFNYTLNESNLTRSLNTTITKNDNINKSLKTLPLQSLSKDQKIDNNISIMRQTESAIISESNNISVTISGTSDIDDNISLSSTTSSVLHTPETTTPTKEIPKTDGGSPILRGLKSVLNMFRSSQSPITSADEIIAVDKHETLTPVEAVQIKSVDNLNFKPQSMASTPIATPRLRENNGSRRSSPYKDSIVFNDDLEKELQWKDETTIIFSHEKIPVHKLFFQQTKMIPKSETNEITHNIENIKEENFNNAVDIMDVSYSESVIGNKTITNMQEDLIKNESTVCNDSDSEFLDCETTFIKNDSITIFNEQNKLKMENNINDLNSCLENNTIFIYNQDHQDGELELVATTVPTETVHIIEHDKSLHVMIDSLDNNVNEKVSCTELKTENSLKTDEIIIQLDTRNINEKNIFINKPDIENNICSEYELDSLEYNYMSKLNDINATNINGDVINERINKSYTQDMKSGGEEGCVYNTKSSLPTEIPLCDEDNEIEPNMTEKTIDLSNDSLLHTTEANVKVQDLLGEISELNVSSNTTYNCVSHENIKSRETDIKLMIKSNKVNETSHNIASVKEEITFIQTQNKENVNLSDENNTANVKQILIEQKFQGCSDLLDNLNISNFCEGENGLNYSISQYESLDSLNENFSKLQVHTKGKQDNIQLPIDSQVIIENMSNTADTKLMIVDHSVADFIVNEILDETQSPHQVVINSQADIGISHQTTENNLNVKLTNVNKGNLTQSITLALESKQNGENIAQHKTTLTNLLDESKDSYIREESDLKNARFVENKDIVIKDNLSFKLCHSENMEKLNENKKLSSEEIDKEVSDRQLVTDKKTLDVSETLISNVTEKIQDMENNESLDLNLVYKHLETPDTIIDNTTVETSTDTQDKFEISLQEGASNYHKVTVEQGSDAALNEQQLDNTIQNESQYIKVTHLKESSMNGSMNSDINISTKPIEITEFLENNTTLQKDIIAEYIVCSTPDEISNENESEFIKATHVKELFASEIITSDINQSTNHIEIPGSLQQNNTTLQKYIEEYNVCPTPDEVSNENESEYIKATHVKELSVEEIITSDINLNTNHIEIPESLQNNRTLKNDIPEYNICHTLDEISKEKYISNIIEEKTESINLHTSHIKKKTDGGTLTLNTNYLDKEDKINELDTFTLDEENVLSENNSPYVSVAGDLDKVSMDQTPETFTQIENPNHTVSILNSPPITSKGYNFNFDEIEDPFATKTNCLTLPICGIKNIKNNNVDQIQTPKKVLANDRRKTQSGRKKQFISKKKLNKSTHVAETLSNPEQFDYECSTKFNAYNEKPIKSTIHSNNDGNLMINNDKKSLVSRDLDKTDVGDVPDASDSNESKKIDKCSDILNLSEVNKLVIETTTMVSSADHKNALPFVQMSTNFVDASSSEKIKTRNVFNLPEIDDMNFNPFAVKSRLCQSPLPSFNEDNPLDTKTKFLTSPDRTIASHAYVEIKNTDSIDKLADKDCEDKMETELMEKGAALNRSSDTCSSNASEKDTTVREIHTEDEDTIEGPFIEDLNNDEMPCFDGDDVDMIKFNDIPNQEIEDNAEGELFIDAEAFQFLLNQNKSNVVADSGKESLFLKFDPLFAKRISSGSIITALSKIKNKQSTPIKAPKQQNMSAIASSSTLNITCVRDNINSTEVNTDNLNVTVSKPMMVVPPAVNAIVTPRKSQTPTRTNRYSGTFTSPAMAVIDRLLSLSANNYLVEQEASFTQSSHEQNEANLVLTQLRELLAEKEIHVCNLRSESKDLKDRLIVLESHMSTLETERQQRLKNIDELTETLSKKTNMDRNMAVVFEEYESTIANLISQIEKDKKQHAEERTTLIKERNEQTAHLTNMEVSFNDLHSKYEKIKQIISNYKANEESYKKTLMMYEENFKKAQKNYELLKQHATSKLNYANEELQKVNRAHEAEVLKMNAMIKRKDLHITSLEETLAQKTKANEELTSICDELINKVG